MLVNSEKMISVGKLQRELTQRLRELSETGEPLYVLKNNSLTAVILSPEDYEFFKEAEELLEHLEIAETIKKRLKGQDRSKNIPWEKVRAKYAL
jgi:PHD/YefM family antitoxin component YafN of YafNO toxin-antitoxin module